MTYVVVRRTGLGGRAETYVVKGYEPFTTFETLADAVAFIARVNYRRQHQPTSEAPRLAATLRDLQHPAWSTELTLPEPTIIHVPGEGGNYGSRWHVSVRD